MHDATDNTFTCAICGETFEKGWMDEEAAAEAEKVFGAHLDDDAVVCDDCFKQFMSQFS